MINGEGTRENTRRTTSSDRFDEFSPRVHQKPEVTNPSPEMSDYSSCGESELERYCSANSVMGTPSLCSSVGTFNDFLDLDFGSVKCSGVGEDLDFRERLARNLGDKSVSTSGGFDYLLDGGLKFRNEDANEDCMEDRRTSSRVENWSKSLPTSEENSSLFRTINGGNMDGSSIASIYENGLNSAQRSSMKTSSNTSTYDDRNSERLKFLRVQGGSDLLPTFVENHNSQVAGAKHNEEHSIRTGTSFHYLSRSRNSPTGDSPIVCEDNFSENVHDSFDPFDVKESGSPEEEDTSSRYELSDDDGSMFNCGTDDECRIDSYNTRNLHYLQDSKNSNKSPLLVGSAVAFGSDDWDDFVQETENNFVSLSLDKPQDMRQENLETEGNLVNSISMVTFTAPNIGRPEQTDIVRNVPLTKFIANGKKDPESCPTRDSSAQENNLLAEKASPKIRLNVKDSAAERVLECVSNKDVIGSDIGDASENVFFEKSKQSDSAPGMTVVQLSASAITEPCGKEAIHAEDLGVQELPPLIEDDFNAHVKATTQFSSASVNQSEEHLAPIKVGKFEAKESYDEVVLEMEEILLDSTETPGARFPQRPPQPFRDGSSTASTSGTDDVHPLVQHSLKIDGVEVVGAKQKKGDVSLGERLVGVKEYTVYLLRVWSGKDQWEVERRYRDFFTLYRQLKTLYANHGWSLPTPWSRVEQESRKFFGNASPNVVSERSSLIQECLRSILHSGIPNSAPGTLNWFLSPQKAISSSSLLNTVATQSTSAFMGGTSTEDASTFGKTISLLVEIQPRKSVKQLLEAQHYVCAGCHKRLDTEKSLMRGFVHTLGWGKPRPCEYTGQLFCASCHTNETAVLPARVLHFWDFTEYPVSQMAKSYLDSIYEQPMLCVSAVNPFLFSKVPTLLHVVGIRRKIGAMMPYVRCPFRRSIQRGVGPRRYLLESNEFFALRDLVDLSKGAFSALPIMVETVSTKILDHITQQCLVCCDVGIPCGARQACEDPSSLIFPFQEDEIKRCGSCKSVFHKPCFRNLSNCPCIAASEVHKTAAGSEVGKSGGTVPDVNNKSSNEALDALAKKPDSGSPVRFLSHFFSKKKQDSVRKNSNPVILMGSLPATFSDPM